MNENFYTIAVLTAKEGRLDDLKSVREALAKETRKESGAIEYFFIHDEHHNPNTIVSYEKWENVIEEAFLTAINSGGNNLVRDSLTGALSGAQAGLSGIPERFITGFKNYQKWLDLAIEIARHGTQGLS